MGRIPADPDILEEVKKIATVNLITLSANDNAASIGSQSAPTTRHTGSFVPVGASCGHNNWTLRRNGC